MDMRNFTQTTMDERGNVLLSSTLTSRLNWNVGTALKATHNPNSGEVALTAVAEENGDVTLDAVGRVKLPKPQRDKLGWLYVDTGDILGVTLCMWTQTITLNLQEKFKRECIFCGRPESITKIEYINDKGICDYCIDSVC